MINFMKKAQLVNDEVQHLQEPDDSVQHNNLNKIKKTPKPYSCFFKNILSIYTLILKIIFAKDYVCVFDLVIEYNLKSISWLK